MKDKIFKDIQRSERKIGFFVGLMVATIVYGTLYVLTLIL